MQLKFKKQKINKIQAPNFVMSPIELKDYIDFEPKRIYYVTNQTGATGSHCHKVEIEFFVMIAGSATAMIDSGNGIEDIPLTGPTDAIYVGNFVWHGFKDFSEDAVLLAISSTNYMSDRSDYIEDYELYKQTIKDQGITPSEQHE